MSESAILQEKRDLADDLAREGVRAEAKGNRHEAIRLLSEAVATFPEHPVANIHLGILLTEEGRFEQARNPVETALASRPDSAAFHLFAGRAYFDAGNYDAARQELDRALALSPGNDLAAAYRTLVDWRAGDVTAAERLNPDNLPDSNAFLARLLMLIEADLGGRSVEFVKENPAVPVLDRLRFLFEMWLATHEKKRGDFDHAAMRAQLILEIQPGYPAGVVLARECRLGALDLARQRVAESPDNAELHIDLAAHLAEAEEFSEADAEMAEASRLLGDTAEETLGKDSALLRLRGRIAYGLGQIEEATELTEAGVEPGFAMTEINYYRGLCAIASGRSTDCVKAFRELVAKVCWAVPMRLREYLFWRRQACPTGSEG